MSKGSKPRPTDSEVYGDSFDKIFGNAKKKKPQEGGKQKLSWDWAKKALVRQEEEDRKKKK
tara:strand:+ start:89 stop:271 length:183 start_codon:yes stop_codon:yes gene_type:complete